MASRPVTAVLAAALFMLVAAPSAHARINPAVTIDGPDPAIVELGGVAMAEDGTGGVAYRRSEDGRTHVYAARFDGRQWHSPQRVDVGQQFNSAWPRIGAANGGRLVVVWTQDGGEGLDSLWSAAVPRGGTRFQPPTLVDFTVGEDQATHPSVAMTSGGAGLLVYRAITAFSGRDLPAGYVRGEIRMARFDGSRWQRIGTPANRNRAAPLPSPTPGNAPRVAVDAGGNGIVAWQEPDDEFIDRVWARRIFGSRLGIPLLASSLQEGGQSPRVGADQLALAEDELGRGVVLFRQLPDPSQRALPVRLHTNQLDESGAESAGRFGGPMAADDGAGGDPPGPPALALGGREDVLLAFPRAGEVMLALRSGGGPLTTRPAGSGLAAPAPVVTAGLASRNVLAYARGSSVVIEELKRTAPVARAAVAGRGGGPVHALAIAGSGAGDALVAFGQGRDTARQISVSVVDAAPAPFALTLPVGWTRQRRPRLSWERSRDALGPVRYVVEINRRRVARTSRTRLRLRQGTLRQGRHRVRVLAFDSAGQQTPADPDFYRLDHRPPRAVLRRHKGRRVTVRIVDPGRRGRRSGPGRRTSSIAWGDGLTNDAVSKRARHRYRRPGRYRIVVRAVDKAGNRFVWRLSTRVR
jgi:hypothetical protein